VQLYLVTIKSLEIKIYLKHYLFFVSIFSFSIISMVHKLKIEDITLDDRDLSNFKLETITLGFLIPLSVLGLIIGKVRFFSNDIHYNQPLHLFFRRGND